MLVLRHNSRKWQLGDGISWLSDSGQYSSGVMFYIVKSPPTGFSCITSRRCHVWLCDVASPDIPLHACCIHVALIIIHAAGHYHFRDDWRPTSDRNRTCVADCSLSHAVINALLGLSNDAAEYVAMKVGKLISRESVRGCMCRRRTGRTASVGQPIRWCLIIDTVTMCYFSPFHCPACIISAREWIINWLSRTENVLSTAPWVAYNQRGSSMLVRD